ncbi:hypothetical protein [Ruminiclostridium cellobioparum]|uniref:Uncharacterized protein n=1 Tax=Ruminiclostridium cellobioparum subsp. termitidis CT1112 TaxID=1195236 RepID=S0FJV6_RUMCE|nr:hypothetical protein [Ruminiclostridium cellobioparum]EMS70591.1 hypothetical protein CTER_3708 [Ruminiclostridium cellobioparum subsp. termitidis CT1112]
MELTGCYSELKASLEALSKENINDLSYLYDRVMVKLQLFMYTYRIELDDHDKLKITLSSEIDNLDTSDSIARVSGVSSLTISGLALMFILIALMQIGISTIFIYLLFCGVVIYILCLLDIFSTSQQYDKRKKIIFKMCIEILDKEKEKLDMLI